MRIRFSVVATALAAFAAFLTVGWSVFPGLLLSAWGLETGDATTVLVLAQRTAALYLGLAVLGFLARRAGPSPARRAIAVGTAVLCAALAFSGVLWFAMGVTGVGALATAVFELLVGAAYLVADRTDVPARAIAAGSDLSERGVPAPPPAR
ncbi:hypothetical protein [Microbacterium sp. GXF7504]